MCKALSRLKRDRALLFRSLIAVSLSHADCLPFPDYRFVDQTLLVGLSSKLNA